MKGSWLHNGEDFVNGNSRVDSRARGRDFRCMDKKQPSHKVSFAQLFQPIHDTTGNTISREKKNIYVIEEKNRNIETVNGQDRVLGSNLSCTFRH